MRMYEASGTPDHAPQRNSTIAHSLQSHALVGRVADLNTSGVMSRPLKKFAIVTAVLAAIPLFYFGSLFAAHGFNRDFSISCRSIPVLIQVAAGITRRGVVSIDTPNHGGVGPNY